MVSFQLSDRYKSIRNPISLLTLAVVLASCGGEEQTVVFNSGIDTVFALPAQLRNVAAVVAEDLTLEVRVNDQIVEFPRTSTDEWSAVVNVPANRTSAVRVRWSQSYPTRNQVYDLTLAEQQKDPLVGSAPKSIDFTLGGYNTESHDFDDDGLSNLAEIEQNRSPLDRADVYIGPDGTFPTGLTRPFSSECGSKLPIAIRVRYTADEATIDPPEDLTGWWCATYVTEQTDAAGNVIPVTSIKIIVNVSDDIFPVTDSPVGREYDDDSIEIFIDANNSRGTNYDGRDDYHFRFLADGDNSQPLVKGPSLPLNLMSSMQLTTTGYQLSAYIPQQEVGIRNGQPFGINVEVNDDDDGGLRDAKYAWVGKDGVDNSWTQPRSFGTSQIP